jgi:non-lysosomal glucosylceramidase
LVADGEPPKNSCFGAEPFMLDRDRDGAETAAGGVLRAMACATERHQSWASMGTSLLGAGEENVGQFLYLEGMEYNMWNTYDVHFYSSFALLSLFPRLELSLQRDFARAVLLHDPRPRRVLDGGVGETVRRKALGAVPHDMGLNDPWFEVNGYMLHDPARWKDLNPKFVLQVYRDAVATGDAAFAAAAWPAVYAAVAYMDQFDTDGDGMVENEGTPTRPTTSGPCPASARTPAGCGSRLCRPAAAWRASSGTARRRPTSRSAATERSGCTRRSCGTAPTSTTTTAAAPTARPSWRTSWRGSGTRVDEDKARSALGTVLDYNVMRVGVGAVNGMRPDGTVDASSTQSKEVWPGVTYAVAAAMAHEGMREAAFRTAKGAHDAGWGKDGFGYAFQTPEAWTREGDYRSLHYMCPLAIWAMQWALDPPRLHTELRVSTSSASSPADAALGEAQFLKVATMLRLPEEHKPVGYLRATYKLITQIVVPA